MRSLHAGLMFGCVMLLANGDFLTKPNDETADYCPTKYFNVSCPTGSAILMNSAHYGRMPSGKCVGIGYGRCSVSVLTYMHARCTARTRCSVYVSNPDLLKMNPCSRDLAVYLRANHTCVPAATSSEHGCSRHGVAHLSGSHGYIASNGGLCTWTITVDHGQTIRLSTVAFHSAASNDDGKKRCYRIGSVLEEAGRAVEIQACGGKGGERMVYVSKTHVLRVKVYSRQLTALDPFLLKYEALGCASLMAPPGAIIVSDGRVATVMCNKTQEMWNLFCSDATWIGDLGNCTHSGSLRSVEARHSNTNKDSFPYGLLLIVAAGVTLGIILGGLLLSLAAFFMRRGQGQRSGGTGDDIDSDENDSHSASTREGVPRLPSYTSRPYGEYTRERVADIPDQRMLQNHKCEHKMPSAQSESSIYHRDSNFKSGHVYECPQFTTDTPP